MSSEPLRIGFIGPREPLTEMQAQKLTTILTAPALKEVTVMHRGMVGSESQVHGIAIKAGLKVLVWPVEGENLSGQLSGTYELTDVLPSMVNGRELIRQSVLLLAAVPLALSIRTGLWSLVNYASSQKVPRLLLLSSGVVRAFNLEHFPKEAMEVVTPMISN